MFRDHLDVHLSFGFMIALEKFQPKGSKWTNLSISASKSLSDIGKAKLWRMRLSSSRVTNPSLWRSKATNARLMSL